MVKFLADENFPLPVVLKLRELQHDVLTIQEFGQAGRAMSDEEVLVVARAEGRALLTINRKHFIRLHLEGQAYSGIVACTLDVDFAGLAQRIHNAVKDHALLAGQLIRVHRPQR